MHTPPPWNDLIPDKRMQFVLRDVRCLFKDLQEDFYAMKKKLRHVETTIAALESALEDNQIFNEFETDWSTTEDEEEEESQGVKKEDEDEGKERKKRKMDNNK